MDRKLSINKTLTNYIPCKKYIMTLCSESGLSLALCCIVKNEALNLARCLDSVRNCVDQIVLVDTGSEDETVEIAKHYGATIEHFEWCNDFSLARNYSLSCVTCDWILVLDADEEWMIQDQAWKAQLDAAVDGFAVPRTDIHEVGEVLGGAHLRLFRNHPGIHYQGPYHEQLQFPSEITPEIQPLWGAHIVHYGNSDENIRDKNLNRDIPILEKMRQEHTLDLWRLDCLARKYIKVGLTDQAIDCYDEALERLTPHLLSGEKPAELFWIPTLLDALGANALEAEDYETARIVAMRGVEWFPTFPPLNYLTGELMLHLGFPLAAKGYFEHCLALGKTQSFYKGDPFPMDFVQLFPAYGIGNVYLELKDYRSAIEYLNQALKFNPDYQPAQAALKKIPTEFRSS